MTIIKKYLILLSILFTVKASKIKRDDNFFTTACSTETTQNMHLMNKCIQYLESNYVNTTSLDYLCNSFEDVYESDSESECEEEKKIVEPEPVKEAVYINKENNIEIYSRGEEDYSDLDVYDWVDICRIRVGKWKHKCRGLYFGNINDTLANYYLNRKSNCLKYNSLYCNIVVKDVKMKNSNSTQTPVLNDEQEDLMCGCYNSRMMLYNNEKVLNEQEEMKEKYITVLKQNVVYDFLYKKITDSFSIIKKKLYNNEVKKSEFFQKLSSLKPTNNTIVIEKIDKNKRSYTVSVKNINEINKGAKYVKSYGIEEIIKNYNKSISKVMNVSVCNYTFINNENLNSYTIGSKQMIFTSITLTLLFNIFIFNAIFF